MAEVDHFGAFSGHTYGQVCPAPGHTRLLRMPFLLLELVSCMGAEGSARVDEPSVQQLVRSADAGLSDVLLSSFLPSSLMVSSHSRNHVRCNECGAVSTSC